MDEAQKATSLLIEYKRELEKDLQARITLFQHTTGLIVEDIDLMYSTSINRDDRLETVSVRIKL